MLLFNELGRDAKNGLPSWAPDWTSSAKFFPTRYPAELYNADKTRPCHAELEDGLRLKVRSVKVDTVKEVTRMRTLSWKHTSELVELLKEWRRVAGLDSPGPDQDHGQDHGQDQVGDSDDLEELFWRAVFADAIFEHDMEHRKADLEQREHERYDASSRATRSKSWLSGTGCGVRQPA